jgi:hypothetical protein
MLFVVFFFSIIVSTVNFAINYGVWPKFSDFFFGHLVSFYIIFPLNFSSYFEFSKLFATIGFFLFWPLFIYLHYLYFNKYSVWVFILIFIVDTMVSINWLINAMKLTGL